MIDKFDVFEHGNAMTILREKTGLQDELTSALEGFSFDVDDVCGNNKSQVTGRLERALNHQGWQEQSFALQIGDYALQTHKIDCCKDRVALEIEWNNKEPYFDRDLAAFRMMHSFGLIDCAILVTKSTKLLSYMRRFARDKFFKQKFNSSTHLDKLIPREMCGGSGTCPVLCLGITERALRERPCSIITWAAA